MSLYFGFTLKSPSLRSDFRRAASQQRRKTPISKFRVTSFILPLLVLAALSQRSFNVGEGHLPAQLLQRGEPHGQVPQSDGRHQEAASEEPRGQQRREEWTLFPSPTLTLSLTCSTSSPQSAPASPAGRPPCASSPPSCAAAASGTA